MRQRSNPLVNILLSITLVLSAALLGCDRPAAPPAGSGKIVSLSPAATDLLLGMGLRDRLAGVSSFDKQVSTELGLPRVGDYQNSDWEKISSLGVSYMIVQAAVDRIPPGLKDRAAREHVQLIDLQIDRLDDIYKALDKLGQALDAQKQAGDLAKSMRERLAALPRPNKPVKTLIILSDDGTGVIGRDNFMNDLLTLAGGENVMRQPGYLKVDREQVEAAAPELMILLMPGAEEKMITEARRSISAYKVPANETHRIAVITDARALMPGAFAPDLATKLNHIIMNPAVNPPGGGTP